jgi:hypothetical protein
MLLVVSLPAWAVDDATIQVIQTDVVSTKMKTDDHGNKISNLEGGVAAERQARIDADNALTNEIKNIQLTPGPQGPQGIAGDSVTVFPLQRGDPNCPNGGSVFISGGVSTYACNGAAGQPGLQGPIGPEGATGPQGVQGPTGPAGPACSGGGTISGTIKLCGAASSYLAVYILGESFSALTTTTGSFRLSNVPEGTYTITVDTPPQSSPVYRYTIPGISATNGRLNFLGTVAECCFDNRIETCICPDDSLKWGTKCTALKACIPGDTMLCPNQEGVCSGSVMGCLPGGKWDTTVCNFPAMPGYSPTEICGDGLDNNCNGQTDEQCL